MKKIKIENGAKPLLFELEKTFKRARKSTMTLPHGTVKLPIYMPVGTKGTIKGLTSEEVEQLDCWLLLGNTYHLNNSPTAEYLQEKGGLHKFMNWKRNILTDSGGFQMVSLSKFCEISEQAVEFKHPVTGDLMHLRPEDSIKAQNDIGSDIMMALDDVVKTTTEGPRVTEACERTIRWISRCLDANANPER
jgi:queuine tRNA-ribosyltransferase